MDTATLARNLAAAVAASPDGVVYNAILTFDRLTSEATGEPPPKRLPPMQLRNAGIWLHVSRAVALAQNLQVDPLLFLHAQFETFAPGARPRPPMLYSAAAVRRHHDWTMRRARQYKGDLGMVTETETTKANPAALIQKAIELGQTMWEQMGRPNLGLVAATMANILPAPFLLTCAAVEAGVRSGVLKAQPLTAAVAELDLVPAMWAVIRKDQRSEERAA